eukprot:COSAG06_NODE_1526_length_9195_cov_12.000330_3_plen_1584_part_00
MDAEPESQFVPECEEPEPEMDAEPEPLLEDDAEPEPQLEDAQPHQVAADEAAGARRRRFLSAETSRRGSGDLAAATSLRSTWAGPSRAADIDADDGQQSSDDGSDDLAELLAQVESAELAERIRATVAQRDVAMQQRYEQTIHAAEERIKVMEAALETQQSIGHTIVAGFGPVVLVILFGALVNAIRDALFGGGQCAQIVWVEQGRPFLENFIGAAPIWCRNFLMLTVCAKCCRKVSGFDQNHEGLATRLLVGELPTRGSMKVGRADAAGWNRIVGGESILEKQSSWSEAVNARGLSTRQALAMVTAKLLLWHWSQPLAYLWILGIYKCDLNDATTQNLAVVVAAREVVYFLLTLLATTQCPVFLMLDPFTAWNEANTRLVRSLRVAAYVLTPHNYVALCLANRFRGLRVAFLVLAGLQVIADLGSCFALVFLLAERAEEGSSAPTALLIGFTVTAASFVMFFGPMAVGTNFSAASDKSRHRVVRVLRGLAGGGLLLSLLYIVAAIVLLMANVDIACAGYTFNSPDCGHGTCTSGGRKCECQLGFFPDGLYSGTPMCTTQGLCPARQIQRAVVSESSMRLRCDSICCGGVGNCTADGTCECRLGTGIGCYGFENCSSDQIYHAAGRARPVFKIASGPCTTSLAGACLRSPNYPDEYGNNEHCDVEIGGEGTLVSKAFNTESGYDYLTIDGNTYDGSGGALSKQGVKVRERVSSITWTTDGSNVHSGFEVCFTANSTKAEPPHDDHDCDRVCCGDRGVCEAGTCVECKAPYGGDRCNNLVKCSAANTPCCGQGCTDMLRLCSTSGVVPSACLCGDGTQGQQCAPVLAVSGIPANLTASSDFKGQYIRGDQKCHGFPVYELQAARGDSLEETNLHAFLFRPGHPVMDPSADWQPYGVTTARVEYSVDQGSQQCSSDGLWYDCDQPVCSLPANTRICDSNAGLYHCACPESAIGGALMADTYCAPGSADGFAKLPVPDGDENSELDIPLPEALRRCQALSDCVGVADGGCSGGPYSLCSALGQSQSDSCVHVPNSGESLRQRTVVWAVGLGTADGTTSTVDCSGEWVAFAAELQDIGVYSPDSSESRWKGCESESGICSLQDSTLSDGWVSIDLDISFARGVPTTCALSIYGADCGPGRECVEGGCECVLGSSGPNCTTAQCSVAQVVAGSGVDALQCGDVCCGGGNCTIAGTCECDFGSGIGCEGFESCTSSQIRRGAGRLTSKCAEVCCGSRGVCDADSGRCVQCEAPYGGDRCQNVMQCAEINAPCCGTDCAAARATCSAAGIQPTECTCSDGTTGWQCAPVIGINGDANTSLCSTAAGAGTARAGSICTLPFSYQGVMYNECTDTNNDAVPWCYTGAGLWGNCVCATDFLGQYIRGDQTCDHFPVYEMHSTQRPTQTGSTGMPAYLFQVGPAGSEKLHEQTTSGPCPARVTYSIQCSVFSVWLWIHLAAAAHSQGDLTWRYDEHDITTCSAGSLLPEDDSHDFIWNGPGWYRSGCVNHDEFSGNYIAACMGSTLLAQYHYESTTALANPQSNTDPGTANHGCAGGTLVVDEPYSAGWSKVSGHYCDTSKYAATDTGAYDSML